MTEREALIKRKRNRNKLWYQGLSKEHKKARCEKSKEYFKKYPWLKHYYAARQRVYGSNPKHLSYKGIPFLMNKDDFKELWVRDCADNMKKPSIDRVLLLKGYVLDNCRFIELSLNVRRASLGNTWNIKTTPPQTWKAMYMREYRAKKRELGGAKNG